MRVKTVGIALAVLFSCFAAAAQESAWDAYSAAAQSALESGDFGPVEARILDALTPEQANAWADGADPASIVLEDGSTLADLLSVLLAGGQGLVYVPLDACESARRIRSVPVP